MKMMHKFNKDENTQQRITDEHRGEKVNNTPFDRKRKQYSNTIVYAFLFIYLFLTMSI